MCNAKERLSHLLEVEPIGPHNQRILPNVDAVNMVPRVALEEYGMMVLKIRAVYRAIFENRLVTAFLRGTPGIEAWSMLGKAYYHTKDEDESGRRRYDVVILDAPATGHGLEMLRVPQVIVDVAPPGLLRREAESALTLFRNAKRTGVVMVTLPEEMPTTESLELHAALTDELRMTVTRIVVNSVLPQLFDPGERDTYAGLPGRLPDGSPLVSLAEAGRMRVLREQVQRESIARLDGSVSTPRIELPFLFMPEFRRSAVESLSHAFG